MARRRTISHRDTALLSVVGGATALAAVTARLALPSLAESVTWLDPTLGTVGIIAWFLGTATGILALSTAYRKSAVTGLVLCALTIAGYAAIVVTGAALTDSA